MELNEEFMHGKTVYSGKILEVRQDTVRLPNGRETLRDVVTHPGAVAIVPITDEGKIVMVKQYRYPVRKVLLEIPAGKLDPGEKPDDCAKRELSEETGYQADHIQKMTAIFTSPGFSDEIIHLYVAKNLKKAKQNLDEDEFLNVVEYTPEEVRRMMTDGSLCDAKSIAALLLAQSFPSFPA